MRLVQALVAECQLCSYFVQLHRIHYKRRTLNLQIKHRQCWFNNFESTCSLLNCRLQFLCPSCISLMFKQHPSITFFCQHPSTYFWQHPSQLVAGRRPSNWWALHRQKPMQLKMRWTSSLSKLTTGSPKLTSLQSWPLTKVDLLPLQVTERLGERLQNINLWKFELEKVFKLVLILKRQFFNDLGSQTTRDITAEIELLMVEKRRLEYGIQVIW